MIDVAFIIALLYEPSIHYIYIDFLPVSDLSLVYRVTKSTALRQVV